MLDAKRQQSSSTLYNFGVQDLDSPTSKHLSRGSLGALSNRNLKH